MGIISRLLLFIYAILVAAGLIISAGVCLNIIPREIWQLQLEKIISAPETLGVISLMFLASLCLLHASISTNKKSIAETFSGDDIELNKGSSSEVKITVEAIKSVVERAALTVQGVRQVQAEVFNKGGDIPLKANLEIVLSQGYSAPQVSAEINSAVNDALVATTQISGVPVEVKITEVTHAIVERERRVV